MASFMHSYAQITLFQAKRQQAVEFLSFHTGIVPSLKVRVELRCIVIIMFFGPYRRHDWRYGD
jgi:hypothetical protein